MAVLLEEAIQQLRERIAAGARRIALRAPPGFGKTTVLRGLSDSLAGSRRVVRIEVPEGDDAALVALVEAAAQLDGGTPELLDRVVPRHEPARVAWASRLLAVREALSRGGQDVVVLLDGPRFQTASGPEGELFARRAVELTEMLLDACTGTLVLAGPWIPGGVAEDAGFRLPLVRDPRTAHAQDAVHRLGGRLPHVPPPVVQQVLRALVAANVDVARIPAQQIRLDHLVRQLGRVLAECPEGRRVIARLTALRVPFSSSLLERAGFVSLSDRVRGIIDPLVEELDDGSKLIPDALARAIRGHWDWKLDELQTDAHHFAAVYHRERFQAAHERGDVAAAVREELEEIHQLTEAGDAVALLSRSLQFVEQYDALGKALSQKALRAPREQEERLRRDAVRAYERAIEHDERDAYAHHYIAFNLDVLGMDPERVEREYIEARDLAPWHPWYHGRYVCFLVTRVWMKEARAAWDRALNELAGSGPLQAHVYEELHGPVARLLLSRSRLDFAVEVLEDVPRELRGSWWHALDQLRICLEEDRDERLVFPPILPLAKRWEGPHLADKREVNDWKPGRVLGLDEEIVLLLVASGPDTVSTVDLSADELREAWSALPGQLRPGTFVELIEYADGTKGVEIWDRLSSSFEEVPGLPKLFPHPDRYVRRAFA
ncbi:hypothetical protein SOCEGT47_038390 [Sorangium cellulosum]|uniref:Uncharacterized protein n=1 Tax=Sorangium cellulosum TaxID=56 RepID=A0A4P2Q2V7_SORCE|nr:hypothetical protein [Sorangium cellulosum]AUX23316.1 hypothetical protein SOCEGT47_038390 [Sorangium cellulosum]